MDLNRTLATAVAALVAASGAMAATPALASQDPPRSIQAKDDLAPLLKTRELVAGDTWRQTVRVAGYRQIKLQVKSGAGRFRTVSTYKVPKNGRVKLSHTFATPGQYLLRSLAVPDGKGKSVTSKPVIVTAVAKRYQGTFGGEQSSGTSWNGSVTFFYQERDPITNQRWQDGAVHYTGIEGAVTWNYNASVLNGGIRRNCTSDPSTGQVAWDSVDASMTVQRAVDETYKGRQYDLAIYVSPTPTFSYTCEYFDGEFWETQTRQASLQFGPNTGDLLTNSLSVAATGVNGRYTTSWSAPLVGDINRPPEAITNRWYWDLAAS